MDSKKYTALVNCVCELPIALGVRYGVRPYYQLDQLYRALVSVGVPNGHEEYSCAVFLEETDFMDVFPELSARDYNGIRNEFASTFFGVAQLPADWIVRVFPVAHEIENNIVGGIMNRAAKETLGSLFDDV